MSKPDKDGSNAMTGITLVLAAIGIMSFWLFSVWFAVAMAGLAGHTTHYVLTD